MERSAMMILRVTGLALAIALTATIFWAVGAASFSESFGRIIADPWGIVTLVDLYTGFIITSVLMFVIERGRPWVWLVIVPTFFLGNVVPALWMAYRAALLLQMNRRQAETG
jgi:hypothetical protein